MKYKKGEQLMKNTFNTELCEERKKKVNETLERHEDNINKLEEKFNNISRLVYETTTEVKALTESVSSLTNTLKWGFGLFMTILIAVATLIVMIIK